MHIALAIVALTLNLFRSGKYMSVASNFQDQTRYVTFPFKSCS